MEQRRGKRFACGDRVTDAGEVEFARIFAVIRQQSGKICRHRKKERWTVTFNIGVNRGGDGTQGRKNRCRTAAEGEVACISEAVGKKQSRDTEAAVALFHLQDAFSVQLAANDHVVMKMDATLGGASASGGVEPERGFVFAGVRG